MTKSIAAIFVAIMLLAQIGVAQHNAVHFTDHSHYEHNHDDHNDEHEKNASENCQICLLTKSLSFALFSDSDSFVISAFLGGDSFCHDDQVITADHCRSYNPRAPPVFLI